MVISRVDESTWIDTKTNDQKFSDFSQIWFLNQNLVFRPGKTGFWFFSIRAIDSEHGQRGVYQFTAPKVHFKFFDLGQVSDPPHGVGKKKYRYIELIEAYRIEIF